MNNPGECAYKVDRDGWPPGPWDSEPDRWEDREAGFPVLAVRNDLGAWCGYVGMPPGHPWHGRDRDSLYVEEHANGRELLYAHGGLTFHGPCQEGGVICHVPRPGEPAEVWWFGFDCAHIGDLWPADLHPRMTKISDDVAALFPGVPRRRGGTYRDLAYVEKCVRAMAHQARRAAERDGR